MALHRGDVALGDDRRKAKMKHRAALRLASGVELHGYVFTLPRERLLDLMNDSRSFIPFEREDGEIMLVAKSRIEMAMEANEKGGSLGFGLPATAAPAPQQSAPAQAAPAQAAPAQSAPAQAAPPKSAAPQPATARCEEAQPAAAPRPADAYTLLGVDRSMSGAEIQTAFRRHVENIHPDRLRQSGADQQQIEKAEAMLEEARQAYQAIRAERMRALETQ